MTGRVLITGAGMVTAAGVGVEANLRTLMDGEGAAFAPARYLHTSLTIPVAEVPLDNNELTARCGLHPSEAHSRTYLLALLAAQEALDSAHISSAQAGKLGLVAATTGAGIEVIEACYDTLDQHLAAIPNFSSSNLTDSLARYFGITHPVTTISTACSSSANALQVAARLIRHGRASRLLVGGMDGLSRFSLNGFNSIEIVSPTGCRPFDASHNGVTLGEGAAFLVLESEQAAQERGAEVWGELSGYANRNEAYHPTSSRPDGAGAAETIRAALAQAGMQPDGVDCINAHGTGTVVNDQSEGNAIVSTLGSGVPVTSTKGFTGHTLAACGAVEAIYSLLSIRHGVIFGNNRVLQPMPEVSLSLPLHTYTASVSTVLSNSFGFGGSNTVLIFAKA